MPPAMPFEYLSDERLAALGLTTQEIADCIEKAVRAQAGGRLWAAPKTAMMPGDGRYMMATLSACDDPAITAVKSVTVSPENPSRGLPGIVGAIMLMDSQTGELRAVTDAGWITAVRTAGLSAVMARKLANPASASIGFIGTGVQAHSHLRAFCDLFPISHIKIYGRGQANIDKLAGYAAELGLTFEVCADSNDAISDVDIVVSSVTLNYDIAPFLNAENLKKGAFASITDLGIPWLDNTMTAFQNVFVDDAEQEKIMEKPMIDPALISGDLASLITGRTPAEYHPDTRKAFVFRGLAIGDLAVAALAWRRVCG